MRVHDSVIHRGYFLISFPDFLAIKQSTAYVTQPLNNNDLLVFAVRRNNMYLIIILIKYIYRDSTSNCTSVQLTVIVTQLQNIHSKERNPNVLS